jgi:hypothetical protein
MGFAYQVGDSVAYKPVGAKLGLFTVMRWMPEEFQAVDRRYLIRSVANGSERNVMECDLSRPTLPDDAYDTGPLVRRVSGCMVKLEQARFAMSPT